MPQRRGEAIQGQQREMPFARSGIYVFLGSPVVHLQLLIAAAVLFGGGGVAYGMRNLVIQLLALLILALNGPQMVRFFRHAPSLVRILLILTLALPLIQLVPLPPSLWQSLPGRDLVTESYEIVAPGEQAWFPASLDRARTLVAFTGLIVPAAIVMLAALMTPKEKAVLVWTLVGCVFAAFLWGAVQLSAANSFGLLYPVNAKPDVLYATFANRNSTGLLFVGATIMVIALAAGRQAKALVPTALIGGLLLIGTILTQSRSSMALLLVPGLFLALRLVQRRPRPARTNGRRLVGAGVLVGAFAVLIAGAIAFSGLQGGRVADSLERFTDGETDRPEMWEDGLYAAGQYWPVGSGMGTFDEVFQVHESLEYVSPRKAGRAHNDFIELGIEAGIAGLGLLAAWLGWCFCATLGHLRGGPNWIGVGAGLALGCIALQSLLDYPLRNQTMLCFAGLMIALLVLPRKKPQ